jgi:hypothetical protein
MGVPRSCRDPLSEFAELLVARFVDGKLADNRVQKDWDVREADGSRIQVKYLANPSTGGWRIDGSVKDMAVSKDCPIHTITPEEREKVIADYFAKAAE